ncbi:MAG: serine/threonine-protein kinase [Planctomycetia bacterium]|jgi:serine/threonine protein kinase
MQPPPDPAGSSPIAPKPPRFRATALASGLVPPERLDAVEIELQAVLDRNATPAEAWDKGVAELLVKQRILTRFQAREMLAGRRRFRLGQYTVLDEIGRGGMGQVFLAEHALMGREVAVKVLPRARATPEYEAAFRREIRMLAGLDHENLVRALDAGYDAKVYYLVTEFVPGFDLRKQVRRYGPLDALAAGAVMTQAARGLAYAHEHGVVHRDVKPGNLLVTQEGRVKVLDLGLAGSAFDPETQQPGRVIGTMDYMAPEQIRAPESAGPAADVYALGCTLYFALTGQPPFAGGSRKEKAQRQLHEQPVPVQQVAPGVDPGLARLLEAMMRKSPAERIPSARELIDLLRPWTPRTLVPMSRIPLAHAGRGAGDETDHGSSNNRLPPPIDLLGPRERSGSRSAAGKGEEAGGPSFLAPPLPPPPVPRIAIGQDRGSRHRRRRPNRWSAGSLPLPRGMVVPLAAGVGVWLVTALVRLAGPGLFSQFFGPLASPLVLGVGAGLLVALGQAITGLFSDSGS